MTYNSRQYTPQKNDHLVNFLPEVLPCGKFLSHPLKYLPYGKSLIPPEGLPSGRFPPKNIQRVISDERYVVPSLYRVNLWLRSSVSGSEGPKEPNQLTEKREVLFFLQ